MYEFHKFLRFILLLLHSFWIPQIVMNVARDSRKPMHPHYILGMTVTRIAIPLYVFGCPHNFMRIEPDKSWCICLALFMGLQVFILLLQHYFGARCFIPRQVYFTLLVAIVFLSSAKLLVSFLIYLFFEHLKLQSYIETSDRLSLCNLVHSGISNKVCAAKSHSNNCVKLP